MPNDERARDVEQPTLGEDVEQSICVEAVEQPTWFEVVAEFLPRNFSGPYVDIADLVERPPAPEPALEPLVDLMERPPAPEPPPEPLPEIHPVYQEPLPEPPSENYEELLDTSGLDDATKQRRIDAVIRECIARGVVSLPASAMFRGFNTRCRKFLASHVVVGVLADQPIKVRKNSLIEFEERTGKSVRGRFHTRVDYAPGDEYKIYTGTINIRSLANFNVEEVGIPKYLHWGVTLCTEKIEPSGRRRVKIYYVPAHDLDWYDTVIKFGINYFKDELMQIINEETDSETEVIKSNSTWGYEIEGGLDVPCLDSARNRLYGMGFRVVGDSSVCTGASYDNLEVIVDGYLTKYNVLDATDMILDYLSDKLVANETCSVHVHIGRDSWNSVKLFKLAVFMLGFEQVLYDMLFPTRKHARYCAPLEVKHPRLVNLLLAFNEDIVRRLQHQGVFSEILKSVWYGGRIPEAHGKYDDTRYVGFNLHAYWYMGTIEFRYFDHTYEDLPYIIDLLDKIVYFTDTYSLDYLVELTQDIIKAVKNGADKRVIIEELLYMLGVSANTKALFISRYDKYHDKEPQDFGIDYGTGYTRGYALPRDYDEEEEDEENVL